MRSRIKTLIRRILNALGLKRRTPPLEQQLGKIEDPFRSALLSMYSGHPQRGIDGKMHVIDKITSIAPPQGLWLYDLCLSVKPQATLEIGMAYGFSTLFFLAAAAKNGIGYHTAIDPFQRADWNGIGLAHAQALAPRWGNEPAFRHIEERSDRAATDLARANCRYDLIFIDGNHRFDDVLVDFYLYAPLCRIGGLIILDDVWMSSVQTAIAFIGRNRTDFCEVPAAGPNVRLFRKTGDDHRPWHDFRQFRVAPSSVDMKFKQW